MNLAKTIIGSIIMISAAVFALTISFEAALFVIFGQLGTSLYFMGFTDLILEKYKK